MIQNLDKLGTNLEQNGDATNDGSDAKIDQNASKTSPGKTPSIPKIDSNTLPEHPQSKKNRMVAHSWPKSRERRPKVAPKTPL